MPVSTQHAPRFSDDGTIFTAYTIRSTQLFQTDPAEETQSELDSEADGEITKEVAGLVMGIYNQHIPTLWI